MHSCHVIAYANVLILVLTHLFPGQAKLMVSPAQMLDTDGDGDINDEIRPQIGSVGFVIGTRSLCVYTPLGWIDVEVRTICAVPTMPIYTHH